MVILNVCMVLTLRDAVTKIKWANSHTSPKLKNGGVSTASLSPLHAAFQGNSANPAASFPGDGTLLRE